MTRSGFDEEAAARDLVSEALGVPVKLFDDNSRPRMVDAVFTYPGGRKAALEVVTDVHVPSTQQAERLAKDNGTYSIAGLTHGWYVTVGLGSKINQLEEHLLRILGSLETGGVDRYEPDPWAQTKSGIDLLALSHGLKATMIMNWSAGKVIVGQAAWASSAYLDPVVVSRWVTRFLAEPLGQRKADELRDHEAVDERHAFIWATSRSDLGVHLVLHDDVRIMPDTEAPSLPDGVTHVWVGGSQGVAAWFPDRGWWRSSSGPLT